MPGPTPVEKRTEWAERIREQQESGLSIEKWCREKQIAVHVFQYWKKQLSAKPELQRSSFAELTMGHETRILIEYKGMKIHLEKGCDFTILRECIAVLRKTSC